MFQEGTLKTVCPSIWSKIMAKLLWAVQGAAFGFWTQMEARKASAGTSSPFLSIALGIPPGRWFYEMESLIK